MSTPAAAPTPAATPVAQTQRGVKRERDEGGLQVNGNIPPQGMEGVKIAKAGVAGVRPRPVKKQRLVRHCHLRTVCEVIARFGHFLLRATDFVAGC